MLHNNHLFYVNIVPSWVKWDKKLMLPILLCEKWQDNDCDFLILEFYQFPLLHPTPYNNDSFDEKKDLNRRAVEDEIRQQMSDFQKNQYNLARLIQVCNEKNSLNLGKYLFKFYSGEKFDIKIFEILLDNLKQEKNIALTIWHALI